MRMEYVQTKVLDGMMKELLEEFEPMHVLAALVQKKIVDEEDENQIKARKSRQERVMVTRSALQCKNYDDRWLLKFAEVLEVSAWHRTIGEKLRKETERVIKEIEDLQELYSVPEESFLCLSHLLHIATAIQESDARKLLEYFQVPNTNSNDLGKTLVKFLLCNKIPILRLKEACNKYKLKYLQDINAKHDMILSFPELQGNFSVKLPASRSHKKVSLLESGTLWESSLFPKETSIQLYVFFRGEYDIHFVKLCDEAKSLSLRITSKRALDKLLKENESDVFGENVAKLVYKPINGSKSKPLIRLDLSKSTLENVRKQLSTSVGETSSLSSYSSLTSFEAGYNEEQSTFDYLDMMDRLIQAMNISDMELLCDYFQIDSNSMAKIRGSSNPKRKFIHVCRQNKIWTSKDMSRLVDAVKSNQLTNLENIISARNNDMSLWPEVAVKITPRKPYQATFTKFKRYILGKKRILKSEEEEELDMKLLFKVSTESLDKLKTDIDSGRFLQEILTVYKDETGDNALIVSQEERQFIELIYDENQFKELLQHGANEEKSRQHTFDYLDMMDRLIETMEVSDIDLLCKYFMDHMDHCMDHKSLERIQGSINPKREFIHVCRRKKIWTSGDTLHLLEAVRSTQLTRLQSIIEDFNDMSLCPEVTLTMKSNVPSGAMAEFEEFLLSSKKRLDTEFRREFKVHLVDCEKGSIVFRLKVPSKDSLDQLIEDIHSGRLLKKLMTMYNERTQKETITILEDGKLSIKLSYDTREVKDASNVLKRPIFTIKDQWKRALMRVQSLMEEDFDPFSLMEILTGNGTLTSTEVDALKATAKRKQRVRLFISFLETKEETAFNSFRLALEGCSYYEELAKALNSEVKGSQSGYLLSGVTKDMTEGSQVSGKTNEISQQYSTDEVDFDIFLESSVNWNIVRAPTKRFVEEENMVASLSTHKRFKTTKEVEELAVKDDVYPTSKDYCSTVSPDMAEKLYVGVGEKKSKCAKTSSSEGEGDDGTRIYRLLLEEVGKCLNKEALERIARLEGLHERDIDKIFQPYQDPSGALFRCLEGKGILHVNDVSRLRQDLETIGQESAAKLVDKYAQDISRYYNRDFPPEPESDDSDDDTNKTESFEDTLKAIGLGGWSPPELRLEEFLKIRCDADSSDIVYSFWQKITCLDYRAGLPQSLASHPRIHCSMRDFIFCVLHCADDFLRQDILEKLSACQLAVPILISGIRLNQRPIFLKWACRTIMKKWKGRHDLFSVEQPIFCHPIFTVSFLRIGNVGVSKSQLLNRMLGPCQGFGCHPYFLTKDQDNVKSKLSLGSIEGVWFLPTSGSQNETFKDVMAFFNLRGDCMNYPKQKEFACKVANLTVAFVLTEERKKFKKDIRDIEKNSTRTIFISVREQEGSSGKLHIIENWVFVKKFQLESLSAKLCELIAQTNDQSESKNSSLGDFSPENVEIDENIPDIKKAKAVVASLFKGAYNHDILKFKHDNFHMQKLWRKLAKLYKDRLAFDTEDETTFEQKKAQRDAEIKKNRKQQLQCPLSQPVKHYINSLHEAIGEKSFLKYFLRILQGKIFQIVSKNTDEDMYKLCNLEQSIYQMKMNDDGDKCENVSNRQRDSQQRDREKFEKLRTECKTVCKRLRVRNLGCEHFLREIGQQFEANSMFARRKEPNFIDSTCFPLYPSIAAELILQMHSFELMDGDTEYVPITWVTAVLDALRLKLNNPKVLVLSIIGVQNSGKSTLLNSMFGLRFPVRAGRCTRGLFIRFLKIDEKLAENLGFQFLIVVDTEGLRSMEHDDHTFDNRLVTFALSISNVTIFNISGENIGEDVAGILQIAAHALMRMKEVDVECRCMIIQQRVSDLTAADRKKANTYKIKQTLDEATKFAAEEEGLEGRYEEFSDVVDLKFDEDLQFVPNLWPGGMTPPNHMYGEKVLKIREGLLRDIRNKIISPDLTLSTFTDRVRDVWSAVNEENFIFSFKDRVKAVDFNQFCLHYNEWIVQMRQAIMDKSNGCLGGVESAVQKGNSVETLITPVEHEVERQSELLRDLVGKYVVDHPRKSMISRHKRGFLEDIHIAVKDARQQAQQRITEEYEIKKLKHKLPNLGPKWLVRMIKDVKEVSSTRAVTEELTHANTFDADRYEHELDELWKKWTKEIKQESGITQIQILPSDIKTLCDKLLLRMTRDMAIGSDIHNLLSKEGGIEKHIALSDCSKYINDKQVKAWIKNRATTRKEKKGPGERESKTPENKTIQYEKQKAINTMIQSIESSIGELKRQKRKQFDRNVFQLLVRKTLKNLSKKTEGDIKLPTSLIAKGLMHLCGRAFNDVFQYTEVSDDNYSSYFYQEDAIVRETFGSFITQSDLEYNTADVLYYYIRREIRKKYEHFMKTFDYSELTERLRLPWDVLEYESRDIIEHELGGDLFYEPMCDIMAWSDDYCEYLIPLYNYDAEMEQFGKFLVTVSDDLTKMENNFNQTDSYQDWIGRLLKTFDIDSSVRRTCDIYENPCPLEVSRHLKKRINESDPDEVLEGDELYSLDHSSLKIAAGLSNVCKETCPMCGMFCDNILKSHTIHSSHLHRPRGMAKETYPGTDRLVLEDCSSSILLPNTMCTITDKEFHCKDYKQYYPDWDILPSTSDPGKLFWQWVFVDVMELYSGDYDVEFPDSWLNITEKEALQSLIDDKQLKTEMRTS